MKSTYRVHLALVLVQIFFGLWHIAGSAALQYMSPEALIAFRVIAAAPILLIMAGIFQLPLPPLKDLAILAGLAVLGVVINQLFYANGLALAGPINASILLMTIPILTLLIEWGLRFERATLWRGVGIAVALGGTFIIIDPRGVELGAETLRGNLYILINAASYAFYLVLARPVFSRVGFLPGIAWVFAFGALELLPFAGADFLTTDWGNLPTSIHAALLFILLCPTIGAYALNAYALERIESSVVGAYIYLQPCVASLVGWWLLDTTLEPRNLVAALIICVGLAFCIELLPPRWSGKRPD